MASTARFAEIASLVGEPARAAMLHALMDGRALTATELARVAGIAPQTGSGHLARLVEAGLITVTRQGRHRYHRLASPTVARMMEGIMEVAFVAEPARRRLVTGPRDEALRAARTCYDHLAGRLGVAMADALVANGFAELNDEAGLITESGLAFLGRLGIDVDDLQATRGRRPARILCRPCLDWSERRPHLAGAVGAALCTHGFALGWIRRARDSRAVTITPAGQRVFHDDFGIGYDSLTGRA
jgi:DNA-binding transcriptional ArsR family regulator